MTDLLQQAVDRIRDLPFDQQDELARLILRLVDAQPEPISLTPEEKAVIATSKAAALKGEFASDEDVRAVWAGYGL